MRILHTSDLHLGRALYQEPLIEEQRAMLAHLVATARDEQVDVVVVAGDVYDRAIPALDAVGLFGDFLNDLADLEIPLVMISGNHDSPKRLGVTSRLIARAGIHLLTDPAHCARPVVLDDAHGPVAFYGLPYLEPALVRAALDVEKATHQAVLGAVMDRIRADLATRPPGTRSVVLAHAFVTDADTSDSERDITAGGVPSVPVSVFEGIHYTALGHLHRCQRIGDRVRYSGSPLAYSFSEADHPKAIWLVDLDQDGGVTARKILCPVPRPLALLTGRIEDLLTEPKYTEYQDSWLRATLTDPHRPQQAMERLRRRFPHTLQLAFAPEGQAPAQAATYSDRVRGQSDHQIAVGFLDHVTGAPASAPEQDLLREGLESVRTAAAQREAH